MLISTLHLHTPTHTTPSKHDHYYYSIINKSLTLLDYTSIHSTLLHGLIHTHLLY